MVNSHGVRISKRPYGLLKIKIGKIKQGGKYGIQE